MDPSPSRTAWHIIGFITTMHACYISSVMSDSVVPNELQPTRHLCPGGFSRQEYWNGLPCPPPPGDLPNPGIEPRSPALQADFFTTEPPGKPALNNTLPPF